ncbi:MAG TPA: hypothetical protein VKZ74_00670 [Natronosporangium sp.]|nr:hypothetical protein [Natronosporangium sp.]
MLLDNPDTADLRAKVTQAWEEFTRALGEAIPALPVGTRLELTLDPTASGTGDASYSVTLTVAEDGDLLARAVGNASLPEEYRMNRAAIADMVALGWSPPGVEPGSGEQFGLTAPREDAERLAAMITRTLRDIYGAPHPAFLVYHAGRPVPTGPALAGMENGSDRNGSAHGLASGTPASDQPANQPASDGLDGNELGWEEPVPMPALGSARPLSVPEAGRRVSLAGGSSPDGGDPAGAASTVAGEPAEVTDAVTLREQVRTVIAAMQRTTPDQLVADADGDIGIRAGTAMVFVKVRDNPPLVDVFSPVLTDVTPSERLYGKLSELTNRMPVGRLYYVNETVWASVPVFGRSFQPSHLVLAVQVMIGLADELDDRLQGEFGGRRFFAEDDIPSHHRESASTGMYL